VLGREWHYDG